MSIIIDFISKYDEVHYDSELVKTSHQRVSRSIDRHLIINFNSLGKHFKLQLFPTQSLFKHDYIEVDNKQYLTKKFIFYNGTLVDEPNSYASGSIIDGVFYGTIITREGKYHVESSKRYNESIIKSHSIIYHENDAKLSHERLQKRDFSTHKSHLGCASEEILDSMKKIQEDSFKEGMKNVSLNPYNYFIQLLFNFYRCI